jgi:hypothetical protein
MKKTPKKAKAAIPEGRGCGGVADSCSGNLLRLSEVQSAVAATGHQ